MTSARSAQRANKGWQERQADARTRSSDGRKTCSDSRGLRGDGCPYWALGRESFPAGYTAQPCVSIGSYLQRSRWGFGLRDAVSAGVLADSSGGACRCPRCDILNIGVYDDRVRLPVVPGNRDQYAHRLGDVANALPRRQPGLSQATPPAARRLPHPPGQRAAGLRLPGRPPAQPLTAAPCNGGGPLVRKPGPPGVQAIDQ